MLSARSGSWWFAWRPVRMYNGKWAWLRRVWKHWDTPQLYRYFNEHPARTLGEAFCNSHGNTVNAGLALAMSTTIDCLCEINGWRYELIPASKIHSLQSIVFHDGYGYAVELYYDSLLYTGLQKLFEQAEAHFKKKYREGALRGIKT